MVSCPGVISGFPYTVFVSLMCSSLWRALLVCNNDLEAAEIKNFKVRPCVSHIPFH